MSKTCPIGFWLQKKDFDKHVYYRGLLCHYLTMGVSLSGKQASRKDIDFAHGVYTHAECPAVHNKIELDHPEIRDIVAHNRVWFEGVKKTIN